MCGTIMPPALKRSPMEIRYALGHDNALGHGSASCNDNVMIMLSAMAMLHVMHHVMIMLSAMAMLHVGSVV